MGRPRKLPLIERLEGNPGKRAIEDGMAAHGRPFVPEDLDDEARGFLETFLTIQPDGLYSYGDTPALAAFARSFATLKRLWLEMSKPDFRMFNEDGKANPCLAEHRKESAAMLAL